MTDQSAPPGAGAFVDLAVRAAGGGVVAASDETFAEKENLVSTAAPTHAAHTFGHKGQIYDGWETRRRRAVPDGPGPMDPAGDDWAVVRLGLPGIVHRVVVDTAFFDGNHPVSAEVDVRWIEGHPSPAEVVDGPWEPLCGTALQGDTAHTVEVEHPRAATHVRLRIHPDGGVARLRVLGEVLPDVRRWHGIGVDLASLAAGGGFSTRRTGTTRRRRTCSCRAPRPTWATAGRPAVAVRAGSTGSTSRWASRDGCTRSSWTPRTSSATRPGTVRLVGPGGSA